MRPTWSFEFRTRALGRRLVRAATVGATAASAAAVAAFAFGLQGGGISFFSPAQTRAAQTAPCASCMKKKEVVLAAASRVVAAGPIHVANPLVVPEVTVDTP